MKLVAYVRVSTREQVEHGQGLDIQEQQIRRWARANKHRLAAIYRDEGVSGKAPAADRPGLAAALRDLHSGQARGLVIARLDRLARSVTVQEAVLAEVWHRLDGHVFEVTGEVLRDDPDDPMRTAMREMAAVFAGLDRGLIVKRLRDGRQAKAASGGHANGRYRYGYGKSGPVQEQQLALRLMLQWREEGASTREIARRLSEGGHPTARGGAWSPPVVARILSRYKRQAAA